MIILGINGGISLQYEDSPFFGTGENHDAAAALIIDGEVVSAIEEERLNRIKHTNKFPEYSVQQVLKENDLWLDDVDYFSIYATEEYMDKLIRKLYWWDPTIQALLPPREYIAHIFEMAFDYKIDLDKIVFVDHHTAHAASCYYLSGFDESLILTIDGVGCDISGRIMYGNGTEMTNVGVIEESNSLGHYYTDIIRFIGYADYEEYKVMGLAPYGDPGKHRELFNLFYTLLPEGKFQINSHMIGMLYGIGRPRRKGQPFEQLYKDVAASLQESLENIVIHMLTYQAETSGYKNLCLSGGVAHNCSANGKIFYSGMFDDIFVMPAAHDAGNSIGSAIYTYMTKSEDKKLRKLDHVYLGTPLETNAELQEILKKWENFVEFEVEENIEVRAAQLMSEGKILGWVQGRSEFGPRALGNRSIIADPRPAENKEVINMMVKKREGYRPFAPSVIQERAHEFFDISTSGVCFDYMTFVVNVREEYQKVLGAITHVDGTARIQTVNKATNPKYWSMISEFGKINEIPMVLNTSFNNNVEPIVDSAEDAIVCFLTTGLDFLVIDNYLIRKKSLNGLNLMTPQVLIHTTLNAKKAYSSHDVQDTNYEVGFNYSGKYNYQISDDAFKVLSSSDGTLTLDELIAKEIGINGSHKKQILSEIEDLWSRRFISLLPN